MPLLWITALPLLFGFAILCLSEKFAKWLALFSSLLGLFLGAWLYINFDSTYSGHQLLFSVPWISALGVRFALGVDALSLPLILLTKFSVPIAILASWKEPRRSKAFLFLFLWLDTAMTGTFLSTDLFLFYLFWEMMLIPMLLLIGVWGSAERIYASIKFFLYTFAGSVLMLVAIFLIITTHKSQFGFYTTDIATLLKVTFSDSLIVWGLTLEDLIFIAFTLAFAIKIPLFPFHTWLPDAHVQAPTGGSVLLAAVLLKMGTYGLLRFSIPFAKHSFEFFAPYLSYLSLIGILYGALVAFQQTDMKKLVAYSSVSHLAFVVLGICSGTEKGLIGALFQNINHGISTGALFFLVGALYDRRHSRNFSDYGGLAQCIPWYSIVFVLVACSSMGVPGLNGFIGEFLILFGAFEKNPIWGAVGCLGVVFGAIYILSFIRQVIFGPVTSGENRTMSDLNFREWAALIPLCMAILFLGLYPKPFLSKWEGPMKQYWKVYAP